MLAAGGTKASVVVESGRQVDLRVVEPDQFGAALQYFTGSKAHNIKLRGIAHKAGLKVNEYGLFRGDKVLASASTNAPDVRRDLKNGGNKAAAAVVGKLIAERAKALGIESVAFDRSGFRYHGRVQALADAARENGLKF